MSSKIVLLPDDLTNKIAAGEVIERPASIVKELLENSLDAGATDIFIDLQKGGCGGITVSDDGEGIDPADGALAFCRYATSKVFHFDDIYHVSSFGFRGEALPSIASIARVVMKSRTAERETGIEVIAEAGKILSLCETGCPHGTSIWVSKIFDPVPVRKKFLKSEPTEKGHCIDVTAKLAIANPTVRFRVYSNGREVMHLPQANDSLERLSFVLGPDFVQDMTMFSDERPGLSIRGFASFPTLTRSQGKYIYTYVNRRFIKDTLIHSAVMRAYRNLIPAKRYPIVVLMLEIPPTDVDVNVHPSKMEVRFRNPRQIYDLVLQALAGSLYGTTLESGSPAGGLDRPSVQGNNEVPHFRVAESPKRYSLSDSPELFPGRTEPMPVASDQAGPTQRECTPFSSLRYLGQVSGTFLLFAGPDSLILLDQHAAHERMLFEKMKRTSCLRQSPAEGQRLVMPEIVSLTPRDIALLDTVLPLLAQSGLEVEHFGGDTVVIKSVPAELSHLAPKKILIELLEEHDLRSDMKAEEIRESIYAFLACKGAVTASHPLSAGEVAALCHDLDMIPAPATCPHGRPMYISFTYREIEKMFKRR